LDRSSAFPARRAALCRRTEISSTWLRRVREVSIRYRGSHFKTAAALRHPHDAVDFARRILKDDAREHFIAVYLESRHRPIAYSIVSIGTANQSLVHPREVCSPWLGAGPFST
jgi:DNA repair protein RadC